MTTTPNATDAVTFEADLLDTVNPEAEGGNWALRKAVPDLVQLGIDINKYATLVIQVVGIISNILTLVLMRRPFMMKTSTAVYCTHLAVADLMHIIQLNVLTWWRKFGSVKWYPFAYNDATCKLRYVLNYVCLTWPAWLVVAMTLERLLAVLFPLKTKMWNTRKTATIACLGIALLSFAVWGVLFLMWGVSTGPCDETKVQEFLREWGYILAVTLYSIAPTILLVVMNGLLIQRLVKAKALRTKIGRAATTTPDKNMNKITVMAITVSVTYFILTLPAMVFTYLDTMKNVRAHVGALKVLTLPELAFLRQICLILRELNHAINFFLYLMILPKVRSELAAIFRPVLCLNICFLVKRAKKYSADSPGTE